MCAAVTEGREFYMQAPAHSALGRLPGKTPLCSTCVPGGQGSPPWAQPGASRAHGYRSTGSQEAKREHPMGLLTRGMDPGWGC